MNPPSTAFIMNPKCSKSSENWRELTLQIAVVSGDWHDRHGLFVVRGLEFRWLLLPFYRLLALNKLQRVWFVFRELIDCLIIATFRWVWGLEGLVMHWYMRWWVLTLKFFFKLREGYISTENLLDWVELIFATNHLWERLLLDLWFMLESLFGENFTLVIEGVWQVRKVSTEACSFTYFTLLWWVG